MLVGDKSTFAVDVAVGDIFDGWVYGTYLLWIRGEAIGNEDDHSVDLKGCWNWMRDLVEHPRDRYEPMLYEMDKTQAYIRLASSVLVYENPSGTAKEMYVNTFARFHISHIGMSSFDRFTLLLVKDDSGMERLIWREGGGDIRDAHLSAGEIERVFADAIRLLEATMISAGDKI